MKGKEDTDLELTRSKRLVERPCQLEDPSPRLGNL